MTGPSEPTQSWTPPPQPSQPTPPMPHAGWQPSPQGPIEMPGTVTAASVILFVMAALVGVFGIFVLLAGSLFGSISDPSVFDSEFDGVLEGSGLDQTSFDAAMGMMQGFLVGFAIIVLLVAAGHLVAGIWVLKRKEWARILALVISILALVVLGFGVAGTLASLATPLPGGFETPGMSPEAARQMMVGSAIVGLVIVGAFFAAYLFVVIVLLRRGDVFA